VITDVSAELVAEKNWMVSVNPFGSFTYFKSRSTKENVRMADASAFESEKVPAFRFGPAPSISMP
jgi:hypothetical protein